MGIGDRFIYTKVSSDWKFGKQCEVVGEFGGCWSIKVVGSGAKPFLYAKNCFPMPVLTEEEIERRKKKAGRLAGIF